VNRSCALANPTGARDPRFRLTGFGLVTATEASLPFSGLSLKGARLAVQGFGAVGLYAARFLTGKGALLVAAADSSGMLYDSRGLNVPDRARHKRSGRPLADYPAGEKQPLDSIIDVPCDIWISAARPTYCTPHA
jgi:glutamate dehydrogenase/leucine dehydrogenase